VIKLTRLLLRILQRIDLQNGGVATALAVVGDEEDIVTHSGHQTAHLKVRSPVTKLNRYLNVQIKNGKTAKKGRAKSRPNGFRRRRSSSCMLDIHKDIDMDMELNVTMGMRSVRCHGSLGLL